LVERHEVGTAVCAEVDERKLLVLSSLHADRRESAWIDWIWVVESPRGSPAARAVALRKSCRPLRMPYARSRAGFMEEAAA
jgi:hypothetical protein